MVYGRLYLPFRYAKTRPTFIKTSIRLENTANSAGFSASKFLHFLKLK